MAITRAHSIIVAAGGDTPRDLAHELRYLADQLERGELTVGCVGGPSCGSVYSYKHDAAMTHDEYFRQIEAQLEAERPATPLADLHAAPDIAVVGAVKVGAAVVSAGIDTTD